MEDETTVKEQKKILVIESDDNNYAKCIALLKSRGFQVLSAARDGNVVVETIERELPQVVLMGLFMPGLDAIGVMEQLKQRLPKQEIRFIITTAFLNPALEREMMDAGACYCFLTPFDETVMADRIGKLAGVVENTPKEKPDLEVMVTEIIHQVGIPAHIKGYHYVRTSILLTVENPEMINSVTKQLYPEVAKRYHTTASRVERAIRHAIEVAWDRGDVDTLNGYFGYTIHNGRGKPTNSEFVAMIADKVRLECKRLG